LASVDGGLALPAPSPTLLLLLHAQEQPRAQLGAVRIGCEPGAAFLLRDNSLAQPARFIADTSARRRGSRKCVRANAEAAQGELEAFEQGPWGRKFPTVAAAWRRAWSHVIPFFAFPPKIRWAIYTTNAIESINSRLRKIIKSRGHFPATMPPAS
jgi:hypothetical protein